MSKTKIACVGDSITEGCNVPYEQRSSMSYPAQLQRLLGQRFEVHNYGYGGRTMIIENSAADESWKFSRLPEPDQSQGIALLLDNFIPPSPCRTFFGSLILWKPDIIIIMLGTNDSKTRHWDKDKFISDYKKLVREFLRLRTKPDIYFCSPPYCFSEGIDTISAKIIRNEVYPAVREVYEYFLKKKERVYFIDTYEATKDRKSSYDTDGVHPLEDGMAAIASAVYNSLKNSL